MQTLQRLYVAIRVVLLVARFGRKPVTNDVQPCIREKDQILSVDIVFLEKILTSPDKFLDTQGFLNMTIADCSLIAAPALLFYFKRRGFSRCRAWKDPTGLGLSASR